MVVGLFARRSTAARLRRWRRVSSAPSSTESSRPRWCSTTRSSWHSSTIVRCSRGTCSSSPGATSSRWPTSPADVGGPVLRARAAHRSGRAGGAGGRRHVRRDEQRGQPERGPPPRARRAPPSQGRAAGFFWPRQRYATTPRWPSGRGAHPRRAHVTIRMGRPSRPARRRRARGARRGRSARPTRARRGIEHVVGRRPGAASTTGPKSGQQQRRRCSSPSGVCFERQAATGHDPEAALRVDLDQAVVGRARPDQSSSSRMRGEEVERLVG